MTPDKFLSIAVCSLIMITCIYLIIANLIKAHRKPCITKPDFKNLYDRKWEILGAYRERCYEHYQNIKCDMYATEDKHNLKVLTIELVEHDTKRDYDLAIFNLIESGAKGNFQYQSLQYKFITADEFAELKQIYNQLNPHK